MKEGFKNDTFDADVKETKLTFEQEVSNRFAKLATMIKNDLTLQSEDSQIFSTFKKESVVRWIQQPQRNEENLRKFSRFLYGVSTHYRRLINYYINMGIDSAWGLTFYGKTYETKTNTVLKTYYNDTLQLLDELNIPHEYNKVKQAVWLEGIFYGYEYHGDDSYYINKLDPKLCRINGVEDGVFVFEYDFMSFTGREYLLDGMAPEFTTKFELYKKNPRPKKYEINYRWQQLSTENTICIKMDETLPYTFPPFIGLFLDVYDLAKFKELALEAESLKAQMLLALKVPLYDKERTPEQFLLGLDTALEYGQEFVSTVPNTTGVVISPFDEIQTIDLGKANNAAEKNSVSEAEEQFWSASGTNANLFSGSATTEGTLEYSVKPDESLTFSINRQFERWVNRKIKLKDKIKEKLAFYFLDITIYNKTQRQSDCLEQIRLGSPVKLEMLAMQGITPSRAQQKSFIENDLLDLVNEWKVPMSSNTTSGAVATGSDGGSSTNEE